ncbi:hypothetical protein GCM10009001_24710 [Virgibacillus siamensis]|uniref:Uncharacterized protein n=1 Tax=Virgibacillus siamensis TaxID=480071 RepID=A0ABP3RFC2_9BACI
MKKLLIAVFLTLVISFGIIGYTQSTDDANDIVEPKHEENDNSIVIN